MAAVNCVLELSIDEPRTEREDGAILRCIAEIKKSEKYKYRIGRSPW